LAAVCRISQTDNAAQVSGPGLDKPVSLFLHWLELAPTFELQ